MEGFWVEGLGFRVELWVEGRSLQGYVGVYWGGIWVC